MDSAEQSQKRISFTLRLQADKMAELKALAKRTGLTRSALCQMAIDELLARKRPRRKK